LILSKFPIVEFDSHIYQAGNQIDSWAAKQVIYAKVQLTPSSYIHVFTTHLQASYFDNHESHNVINDKARGSQVKEMADFVHKKTHKSPYPVFVTGDMNINSRLEEDLYVETEEYASMMKIFNNHGGRDFDDLLKESYRGIHPITYGDTTETYTGGQRLLSPREILLTHKADHCCGLSIDYILFGDAPDHQRETREYGFPIKGKYVDIISSKVEEFLADISTVGCSQLSDHYGVSTVLRVSESVSVNAVYVV